jgi:dynein heavy chain 2
VNLGDLLHPETFLNAFRQKSARAYKVAIDELKLVSSFDKSKIGSQGSIIVEGLYLQGCSFDGQNLVDIQGKTSEIIQLPVCYLSWIASNQQDPYPVEQTVQTPIYFNLDREKLLCTLQMSNNGNSSARIISGVALLLNGSD